jgi:hypothetical protein
MQLQTFPFTNTRDKVVTRVVAQGTVRPKAHSRSPVFLAKSLWIDHQDWAARLDYSKYLLGKELELTQI